MVELGFDIPAQYDTPVMRARIHDAYLPALARVTQLMTVGTHRFPAEIVSASVRPVVTKVRRDSSELLTMQKQQAWREGCDGWSGVLMAYEDGGQMYTDAIVSRSIFAKDTSTVRVAEVAVSKTYRMTVNNPVSVGIGVCRLNCEWTVKEGDRYHGLSWKVIGSGRTDPFEATVSMVTFPPYRTTGELCAYNEMGLLPGRQGDGRIPAPFPNEQTIMGFDFQTVDTLMERLKPDPSKPPLSSVQEFMGVVTGAMKVW